MVVSTWVTIPIAPMTFYDNKKRFSYSFFTGTPGKMRVTIHETIPTETLEVEDKRQLKQQTREVILKNLDHLKMQESLQEV